MDDPVLNPEAPEGILMKRNTHQKWNRTIHMPALVPLVGVACMLACLTV